MSGGTGTVTAIGSELPVIYLNDWSIVPLKRLSKKAGISSLDFLNGSTKIVGFIDIDTVNKTVYSSDYNYKIVASAVKYLADIIHLNMTGDHSKFPDEPVSGETKREILFSGNLTVYEHGKIHGTEISGYNLIRNGRIWMAREPSDLLRREHGLETIILGVGCEQFPMEAILRGYEIQERKREEAENRRDSNSFELGRGAGMNEGGGYRGGGPC